MSNGAFELFSLGLVAAMSVIAVAEGTLLAGIVSVVFGLLVLACGFKTKRLRVFVVGMAGGAAGLIQIAVVATSLIALFSWVNLAVLGAVIILLASFLEKRVGAIGDWQLALREHFVA
ncbi:MAG: hypothetical protein HRT45_11700 [Bdellovibrionales bacterium]|nr:hypothetical protein [Bdellovibrionales bacterium]